MAMQANCVIWTTERAAVTDAGALQLFHSPRAGGRYAVGHANLGAFIALTDSQRARLSTWVVDQNRSDDKFPVITTEVLNSLNGRRPLRVSDKKRRFFEALVAMKFRLGDWIDFFWQTGQDGWRTVWAWTECENEDQISGLVRFLNDEVLITRDGSSYRLTSQGYSHLEQAELGGANTRQVFVAMWFDPSMTDAYENGIKLAIKEAGFEPFRIDRKEHNNKIDDEIIAEIRRSRFVVADFTCGLIGEGDTKQALARGGVYYEAGFAQGLGTPVIWMARKDCISHLHFDTRQFAHIEWDDPADLKTKLYNRIRASIPGST